MADEQIALRPKGDFQKNHVGAPTEMDILAKAFHERGSVPVPEIQELVKLGGVPEDADVELVDGPRGSEAAAGEEAETEEVAAQGEAEAEAEEEEAEEVEAQSEESEDEDTEFVEMGDGSKIPLKELTDGYLRQSDYTRKTQELSEQRKSFEAEKEQYMQQATQVGGYVNHLVEQLENQIKNESLSEQQLSELRTSDPAEYAAYMADAQRKQELANAARAQQQALYNQQRYEIVTRERAQLAKTNEAFADNFDGTYADLTAWVTSPDGGGLPPEMWDQVFDHRAVTLAHKAMLYDKAAKVEAPKVTRKLAKLPKVVRTGRKVDSGQASATKYEESLARARESGTLSDLAAAFAMKEEMRRGR